MSASRPLAAACLWRFLRGPGFERCELARDGEGWRLSGTVLAESEGATAEARYLVRCDSAWRTLATEVRLASRGAERRLELAVEEGRWLEGGREIASLRGCLDVDLSWSPSTNTLPIRRLALAVGEESGPLTAAWVRFPQLTVEPLPQEYARLAERRYRYSSRGGAFTAELEVDEEGLVVTYGDVWERVASDPARRR